MTVLRNSFFIGERVTWPALEGSYPAAAGVILDIYEATDGRLGYRIEVDGVPGRAFRLERDLAREESPHV